MHSDSFFLNCILSFSPLYLKQIPSSPLSTTVWTHVCAYNRTKRRWNATKGTGNIFTSLCFAHLLWRSDLFTVFIHKVSYTFVTFFSEKLFFALRQSFLQINVALKMCVVCQKIKKDFKLYKNVNSSNYMKIALKYVKSGFNDSVI